jgi:hypothetical protein
MELLEYKKTSSFFVKNNTIKGYFDIPENHFKVLMNHFLSTGENLLDDYCKVIYLNAESEKTFFEIDLKEKNSLQQSVSNIRKLRFLDYEIVSKANFIIKKKYKNHCIQLEKERQIPRINAQKFISKKEVREYVFNKYGKICLCCGSTENISLDHIVPVSKNGKNKLNNLQPLCVSCNSSKSTEIIDYRN